MTTTGDDGLSTTSEYHNFVPQDDYHVRLCAICGRGKFDCLQSNRRRRPMPPAITCPNCDLTYYQTAAPHVCAEWVTKENRTMNESEKFITTGVFNHERNTSGNCSISGCPCRGWSAQESAIEHEHEPPARAVEGEWSLTSAASNNLLKSRFGVTGTSLTGIDVPYKNGRRHFGQIVVFDSPEIAAQIVAEHNQHHSLLAEREKLRRLLRSATSPTKCYCMVMDGQKCWHCEAREALNEQGNQPDQKEG